MVIETYEEKLVIISMWDDEPKAAKKAYNEFYKEFKDYVWKVSFQLSKSLPNPEIVAQDIFSDTFLCVKDHADKFNAKRCKNEENCIKNWLAGIARNQLRRYLEKSKKINDTISYVKDHTEIPLRHIIRDIGKELDPQDGYFPNFESLLYTIESILSNREREILLISINFGSQNGMPKEIKNALCDAYGLKEASLRQIKKRAIAKVRKHLPENVFPLAKKIK